MIVTPARAASWTAKLPTPPVAPTIRIVSPSESASASTAASAAMPASGATPVAATSSEAGFGAICISGVSAINSAQLPSWTVGFACKRKPKTSSPTA